MLLTSLCHDSVRVASINHPEFSRGDITFGVECYCSVLFVVVGQRSRCEFKKNKRQFLIDTVFGKNESVCLFNDVTHMSSATERKCSRHNKQCPVPKAQVLIAGTSCTGASRLNVKFSELRTAIAEKRKDVQTVTTLFGFIETLEECGADFGLLENVTTLGDPTGDKDDNLSAMLKLLDEAGWCAQVQTLHTADFFLPQKRTRFYIFLVKKTWLVEKGKEPTEFQHLISELLAVCAFNKSSLVVDDFLELPDSPYIEAELRKIMGDKVDKSSKESPNARMPKWMTDHMDLCEKLGLSWPPPTLPDLVDSDWYQVGVVLVYKWCLFKGFGHSHVI